MALVQLEVSTFSEATPDRTYRARQASRLPADSCKVILNDEKHGPLVGSTTDESFGGVGVLFQVLPTLKVGQNIEYSHNGVTGSTIVRHITRGPQGYLLGLEWRSGSWAQLARRAAQRRMGDPTFDNSQVTMERESFIHTLPSAVHMIWSLCESQNWSELVQYTAQLHDRAKELGVARLEEPVRDLQRRFQNKDTSDERVKDVIRVIKTCVAICGEGE